MSYDLYMNGVLYPITPAKVQIKTKNQNKTIDLINEGEVNVVKTPGLVEISFELLLPAYKYPFTVFRDGFHPPGYYIELLKELKNAGSKFQFILTRCLPSGNNMHNTNITVTLEDLQITDDAKEGFDSKVSVKLKEWRAYGTKTITVNKDSNTAVISEERTPSANEPKTGKAYTVQKGDCLWKIARQFYGSGAEYKQICDSNSGQISDPNLIYPGQVLVIP